jgi:hypothetical protein
MQPCWSHSTKTLVIEISGIKRQMHLGSIFTSHNGFSVYFNPKTDGSLIYLQKITFLRYWMLYLLGTFWGPPFSKDVDWLYRKEMNASLRAHLGVDLSGRGRRLLTWSFILVSSSAKIPRIHWPFTRQ